MLHLFTPRCAFAQSLTTYTRRGTLRPPLSITPHSSVGSFTVNQVTPYPQHDLTHLTLTHPSALQLHQLETSQENNTVAFMFHTPGTLRPGINQALSRWLQCGSKAHPVRNLPQEMALRSFSTAPACLSTDQYLMFCLNSPHIADLKHLISVYWSMLFHPLLRKEDYPEVVSRLTYDQDRLGVEGELAVEVGDSEWELQRSMYGMISRELLGETSSSVCSMMDLVGLKRQEVMQHYKNVVTLPNCKILTHGDVPVQIIAEQVEECISKTSPPTHQPIFVEKPTIKPTQLPKTIAFDHLHQQHILTLSYRVTPQSQQQNTLLQILSYLLFDMPQSPFISLLAENAPYPALYGYRQRYFNVGVSFHPPALASSLSAAQVAKQQDKAYLEKQIQIHRLLQSIVKGGFDQKMVEKCLLHLEHTSHSEDGQAIVESLAGRIIEGRSIAPAFEVSQLVSRLLKTHKKQRIFEQLLEKHIVSSQDYLTLRGNPNPYAMQQQQRMNFRLLTQHKRSLSEQELQQIGNYTPPTYLQDTSCLPTINSNQLQAYEDPQGQELIIHRVKTTWAPKWGGLSKITIKLDATDIGEESIAVLPILCKAVPSMGYAGIKEEAYQKIIDTYIADICMDYETIRDSEGGLKIFVYLSVEFSDRNHQKAFSVLSGLLLNFNASNIFALSQLVQRGATECYHEVSDSLIHYHALHLAASQSPFAFFESPLQQARSVCDLAAQLKRNRSPKPYLHALQRQFEEVWRNLVGWSRMEILWQCPPNKKQLQQKHISLLLSQLTIQGNPPGSINVNEFPTQPWLKYFPNYPQEFVFEAFSLPNRAPGNAPSLLLSSVIDLNISTFNRTGGCFLHKGALVSFVNGSRKKFLELEEYYKRMDRIEMARRRLFQKFGRFSIEDRFRSGVSNEEARLFKQAVASAQVSDLQQILNESVLKVIQQGKSSCLALGPRLQNYEPLLKKGWEIERSIEGLSLSMESLSRRQVGVELGKYAATC